jgi:hypothetical protein
MTNKASLLLAALLVVPTAAIAQTPPAPPAGSPAPLAPGSMMRHHFTFTQADMATMKAQMAKLQAAHKATRAKILAALTPAHRALLASLIGQLAIAANPDPKMATAKLDAALSASEKANILAIHTAAMNQMKTMMPAMMPPDGTITRYKRVMVVKNADGTTTTTTNDSMSPPGPPGAVGPPGGMPPRMPFGPGEHMRHMSGPMTAGEILMHLAAAGEGSPMMMRIESSDHHGAWAPHPPVMPLPPMTPAPAPTPTS